MQKVALIIGIGGVLFLAAQFMGRLGFGGGLSHDPGEGEIPAADFDQRIPRDAITPIYSPEFIPAARSSLEDDEMVLGVVIDGEAHAYSITILNRREIVNDVVGGIPILVTW